MIYVDISEFISNPIRTGIQRIVRQLITYWPEELAFKLVKLDHEKLAFVEIHRDAVDFAVSLASAANFSVELAVKEISFLDRRWPKGIIQPKPGDKVLAPELFYDLGRVNYYRNMISMGVDTYLIVPDFLVWLRPDTFPIPTTTPLMPYLELLLECSHRAFISEAVKNTFQARISRKIANSADVALDLGADGLNVEKQTFNSNRTNYLCIGTLDGRKGQERVYEGFCLKGKPDKFTLSFVGKVPPFRAAALEPLLSNERTDVCLIEGASDADLADMMRRSRAVIYTSPAEGYGLPPMESLNAGIPVVVSSNLPALEGKSKFGQIRLNSDDPVSIAKAFENLSDDRYAARLWREASKFQSTSWKSLAEKVSSWVSLT